VTGQTPNSYHRTLGREREDACTDNLANNQHDSVIIAGMVCALPCGAHEETPQNGPSSFELLGLFNSSRSSGGCPSRPAQFPMAGTGSPPKHGKRRLTMFLLAPSIHRKTLSKCRKRERCVRLQPRAGAIAILQERPDGFEGVRPFRLSRPRGDRSGRQAYNDRNPADGDLPGFPIHAP